MTQMPQITKHPQMTQMPRIHQGIRRCISNLCYLRAAADAFAICAICGYPSTAA